VHSSVGSTAQRAARIPTANTSGAFMQASGAVHELRAERPSSTVDQSVPALDEPSRADHSANGAHNMGQGIEHPAHYLPSQGPIRVFIHHNTLHALQHLPFHEAVKRGGALYGCNPYLPEDRYRAKLARGRILFEDLAAVLLEDLGDDGDRLLGFLGTRYHLRLAMLQHPLRLGPDNELRWLIAETDALRKFRSETPFQVKEQMIERTRRRVRGGLR